MVIQVVKTLKSFNLMLYIGNANLFGPADFMSGANIHSVLISFSFSTLNRFRMISLIYSCV